MHRITKYLEFIQGTKMFVCCEIVLNMVAMETCPTVITAVILIIYDFRVAVFI